MTILDENFLESQRLLLAGRPVRARQIGHSLANKGLSDEQVLALLRRYRRSTFFTCDRGFFDQSLRHDRYCIIFLDVRQHEAATFVRRTLRHSALRTLAQRMGCVVRVSAAGLLVWRRATPRAQSIGWER